MKIEEKPSTYIKDTSTMTQVNITITYSKVLSIFESTNEIIGTFELRTRGTSFKPMTQMGYNGKVLA